MEGHACEGAKARPVYEASTPRLHSTILGEIPKYLELANYQ